jgi:DNA modification methylase
MEKRINWHVEKRKVKDLKPYDKNPRIISEIGLDHLKKSFDEIGFAQPININLDNTILSGHARVQQLLKENVEEVDCYIPDRKLTPKQEEAVIIRMNKNVAGEWNFKMLREEFDFSDLEDYGFSEAELDDIATPKIDEKDPLSGDEEAIPEVKGEPVTKKGDLWILGNHRLLCDDSTNIQSVERLINKQLIDLVYTDPPYGINESGDRTDRSKFVEGSNLPDFVDDSIQYAIDAYNICEGLKIKHQVWWGANYYCHSLPQTNNWIIWDKRVEEKMSNNLSDAEMAWVKNPKASSTRIFRHLWNGMIKASETSKRRVHPTQKPVALAEWCFDYFKDPASTVLDLFSGSGSTLIACEKTDKTFFGMELSEYYCDVIIKRWQDLTGKKAILEKTKEAFDDLV